jgi:hypothetical protein
MVDDWEDWEDVEIDNFIVTFPISDINSKEVKQLEERKLVEEADNALSKELFGTESDLQSEKICENDAKDAKDIKVVAPQKTKLSKQKENEEKQKEFSKKVKELKMKQKRFNELYGESNNYKYDEYDDKYHN